MDSYQIFLIYSYARRTYEKRAALNLPPLRDLNDLPDPIDAEYWVGPGGEKLSGPRAVPSTALKVKKVKKGKKVVAEVDRTIELSDAEIKLDSGEGETIQEEIAVLTDQEEERLRSAQVS